METYLKTLQNQSNVYQSDNFGSLYEGSEQYPMVNFGGSSQMLGESLPNDEQLCNFISSLDSSTSLTFEKLLQSSNQENEYWYNNSRLNQPRPPMYNFPAPEDRTLFNAPSRPRMIRGCHDYRADQWNANLSESRLYEPAGIDLNNNVMPCLDKNLQRNEFSPKRFGCTEPQCQDFLSNQYLPPKTVQSDWNNNDVADINNNACAFVEKFDEVYELKVVSVLYHTRTWQTLAGKFHVLLDVSLKQLDMLTEERQEIEQSIFSDVTPSSPSQKMTRIERLINGYMNEVRPVKKVILNSGDHEEKTKTENRRLVDSWVDCIENIQGLRQSHSYRTQKEYASQQIVNFEALIGQTKRIRTRLWCIGVLKNVNTTS